MDNNLISLFNDLKSRGVISNFANAESFFSLKENKKTIYLGIDCTADSLHIGHLFPLIQTVRFAKEGFKVLIILGEATSKIGDPSDKLKERPQLDETEIKNYSTRIREQLQSLLIKEPCEKFIDEIDFLPLERFYSKNLLKQIYSVLGIKEEDKKAVKWKKFFSYVWPLTENKYSLLSNKDWLDKLSFVDFISEIGRNISINYLLAKETIKQRLENGLSYLAFNYSILQAYDFYYLYKNYDCAGQIGGSDQWGNLTTGLKLIRSFYPNNNDSFAVTFNLLTNKEGKKYSKSEAGNKAVKLTDDKRKFVDFFSNMSDEEVIKFAEQFTFLSKDQIKSLLALNVPPKLRILQRILLELMSYFCFNSKFFIEQTT